MGYFQSIYWRGALIALGSLQSAALQANPYPYNNQPPYYHSAANTYGQPSFSVPPELQPYQPEQPWQPQPYRPALASVHQPMRYRTQPDYSPPPSRALPATVTLSPQRQSLVNMAYRSLGTRYKWGGNTPREGFDCSGLTRFAHTQANIQIPRTALEQSKASRTIRRQELRPGDMIFFKTSGKVINHVGIYVGNGKMIHAATGSKQVMIDDLRKSYWQQRLVKYGTFLG